LKSYNDQLQKETKKQFTKEGAKVVVPKDMLPQKQETAEKKSAGEDLIMPEDADEGKVTF
jgi:ABC-type multidrug transport system fused ATPase/permease subunit